MKKYLQISLVGGAFIVLVLIKTFFIKGDNAPVSLQAPTTVNSTTQTSSQNSSPSTSSGSNSSSPSTSSSGSNTSATFKDGTYTGSVEDAFYGNYQVQAVISAGKLTDVNFLQYPNDNGRSISINTQASPYLKQEAIAAQSANVDIVSGASDSSMAFQKSLATALSQAQL